MLYYNISEFDNCEEFLALLARKFGKLKKGGRADINAAARKVLNIIFFLFFFIFIDFK